MQTSANGHHRYWWTVLPALPPDRDALDWWAPSDGRASRYRRLKRVWFDRTWFQRPKTDPDRPHAFSNPRHGTHVSVAIWESFQLFHPSQFVPAILAAADLAPMGEVVDACWSHEFGFRASGKPKFADMALHARAADGRELIVPIEAKFSKQDRLKPTDRDPSAYREARPFVDFPRCEVLYLVREDYAPKVRDLVGAGTPDYGILTWPRLVQLQLDLADEQLPAKAAPIVGAILGRVASILEIEGFTGRQFETETPGELEKLARTHPEWPDHLRQWLRGAACFLRAQSGQIPSEPPYDYLPAEPSFRAIHELPRKQAQDTREHSAELWRIPRIG